MEASKTINITKSKVGYEDIQHGTGTFKTVRDGKKIELQEVNVRNLLYNSENPTGQLDLILDWFDQFYDLGDTYNTNIGDYKHYNELYFQVNYIYNLITDLYNAMVVAIGTGGFVYNKNSITVQKPMSAFNARNILVNNVSHMFVDMYEIPEDYEIFFGDGSELFVVVGEVYLP